MLSNIHRKETDELYETPVVHQTAFWSNVKTQLGDDAHTVNFKVSQSDLFGKTVDDKMIISDG